MIDCHSLFVEDKKLLENVKRQNITKENAEQIFWWQDVFLQHLKTNKFLVNIFLKNGIKIQGAIVDFDAYVVIVRNASIDQMIFKHAIATIGSQGIRIS